MFPQMILENRKGNDDTIATFAKVNYGILHKQKVCCNKEWKPASNL